MPGLYIKEPRKRVGVHVISLKRSNERFHVVQGTVKCNQYVGVLKKQLLHSARYILPRQKWIFQQDQAPSITLKKARLSKVWVLLLRIRQRARIPCSPGRCNPYSLKLNDLLHLFKQEFVFLNQLLLKKQVFELNNHFLFHRTWVVDIQSTLKFLLLIHDFLKSDNTIKSPIYISLAVSLSAGPLWPSS